MTTSLPTAVEMNALWSSVRATNPSPMIPVHPISAVGTALATFANAFLWASILMKWLSLPYIGYGWYFLYIPFLTSRFNGTLTEVVIFGSLSFSFLGAAVSFYIFRKMGMRFWVTPQYGVFPFVPVVK